MSIFLVFAILFVGTLLILLEIFFIPGFIVGVLGFGLCVWGAIEAFQSLGAFTATLVVGVTFLLNAIIAYFGLKNLHKSPMSMKETITGRVNEFEDFGLVVGDKGKTITDLRPEGKAIFNDQHITVWAFSGFIQSGTEVEVNRISDNKIFVTQLNQ